MEITIVMLSGESHSFRVNPNDTVGALKKLIQDKLGVSSERQRLVYENGHKTSLNDDLMPVSSYGLQNGSRVSLIVTGSPPTIQVFLRNEKGKSSTYDVTPEETVSDFKVKVQRREGVAVSQQRLVFQGREMASGKLSDYGVTEHSTIDMMMRLRGG
ncbi:polyubiquitin-B-like [Labrus mixtus]|uniref:polyubiquitin-B-like n=1 Tax=Labrus mixtus TaxID=508554 RepID=UPI0029BFCC0E|nr:polyubiquitin-B-like [Labrus mixtus]XP_060894124.1 polyubiquitin-B-like [Labrus mixtus]XP_060894125.1 polyubiquitin-B-like [Labrus mixtus]